ncbi:MAG: HAMP domain-containing histidine kinase [Bacteroidetes bacterium]|nr:HAMP domain-containing histidine kinase [Bacteroidota bacterium]
MKKLFSLITVLITLSLIGIIAIQYSWLKNVTAIRKDQIAGKVEMVEFEVVEALVEEKLQSAPQLPIDVLPKGAQDQLLQLLGPQTIAERFSVEEVRQKFEKAFEANGLKGAKFEFAVLSNTNEYGPELASPGYELHYELGLKDSANYWIHVWPLVSLTEEETAPLAPEEKLVLIIHDMQDFVLRSVGWMIGVAVIFTLIIIAAFYLTIRTILTQKKLSEMKTDFINNMTHELRTPLATIAIAVDTLKNEKVIGNRDQLLSIGQIIKNENLRMNTQVEQILQAAQLDVHQVLKGKVELHLHEVMRKIQDKFSLQIAERNAQVRYQLNASDDVVMGHPVHFVNMISNLIDNALKYSKEDVPPSIMVSTENVRRSIVITVQDNGIGMTKDTQSKVFDKFYRAHTGNVHNVKGFGLGLNYTRKMVEAHNGTIAVKSQLGEGSTFTVTLPLKGLMAG